MTDDLELIRAAALRAGALASALQQQGRVEVAYKSGGSPVTNADLEVDELLRTELLAARPGYGWLSEESDDDSSRLAARRSFVVDPIDGTQAFVRGRPWWAVSIAVVEAGAPIAGVVHAPAVDETYEAAAGLGARLNGRPISASGRQALEHCAMLADLRLLESPRWPRPWPQMRVESRNSVAYRMALVASGAFDAAFALSGKSDWDIAAADLIVREAGGVTTDHLGGAFAYDQASTRKRSLVCAPPALHQLILERVGHIELP